MDDRTMPLATFRCPASGDQATVRLSIHARVAGRADYCVPTPVCERAGCARQGKPMSLMQVDYQR